MSEAKFTKGPWVADIRGGCCAVYAASRADETPGCHLYDQRNIYYSSYEASYNGHHWEMSPEAVANANLIAAAPEMYEMLDSAMCRLADEVDDEAKRIVKEIIALRKKARGEK